MSDRKDYEIEELRSYLSEEREKNEKQVRMTMDAHAKIERLRKHLDACSDTCGFQAKQIERLKAALKRIVKENADEYCEEIALAALEGDDDSP